MQIMAGASRGGAEAFFTRLVPALARAGVEQRVVIRREPARAARLRAGHIDPVEFRFGGPLDVLTRLSLRAELRRYRPRIVLTWMSRATSAVPRGDFVHVAHPHCYRCPFGLSYPSCNLACVKNLETAILGEGPETIATVLVEPIMSGVGVAVPPDEYLPEVEKLCRRYDILLHVDEVINGFGRTGKMFAHQHYNISPDIIAIAKGISSAYLPIAATVVKNSVFESFLGEASENRQVAQVNTYGGHPVAAAVAVRNIEIMQQERLVTAPRKWEPI